MATQIKRYIPVDIL